MAKKYRYVLGVDEAGRGPLAGPIAVGAVLVGKKGKIVLKGIKNSKKLSMAQREKWNKILRKNFECRYITINNRTIDRMGIQKATMLGVRRVLGNFSGHPDIVLLDGLMSAPQKYRQKTIIKGDEKEPVIAAASIIAKVARDRKMIKMNKKFPKYGFDKHKGYGTKSHYKKIEKYGISKMHRKSFLKNLSKTIR